MLAEPASANAWESAAPDVLRRRAGLTRPLVNRPIFDPTGSFLGTADLFDPEAGLVAEFDGQDHRVRSNIAKTICAKRTGGSQSDGVPGRQPRPSPPVALEDRLQSRYAQGLPAIIAATAGH